ncbi:MAG: DUF1887 family CARF protein [Anaerolineae bacterium]|nr:DUF1887 family CARF protein [Anaerolineae bacterium]
MSLGKKLQILLVGGRQAPNLIGVLLFKPDCVEFVVSKDEAEKARPLLESLAGIPDIQIPKYEELSPLDPNDFELNKKRYHDICSKYHGWQIQFNITGSTKITAIAAYEAARAYDYAQVFYIDTANGRVVWLKNGDKDNQPIRLNVQDYLQAYGRRPIHKTGIDGISFSQDSAWNAAQILAAHNTSSRSILKQIRQNQSNGVRRIQIKDVDAGEKLVLNQLAQLGAVEWDGIKMLTVRSNSDWGFFAGGWLELYVWHEARTQVGTDKTILFDECAMSLKVPSGQAEKEIDVACLYKAQLIHCSCKSSDRPFETAHLDELSAVSNLIGGRFCSRLFITNQIFNEERRKIEFLAQAKQREIVVVAGDELANIGKIIARQAEKPDYWRM